ncbi:MAG: porin family protein [Prevotella sp.]|nr:porin family protein [Prevotella sp.]
MRSVVIAALLALVASVHAQTEPEYKLELGGGIGMVSYQGDFNGNLFKNPQPMFTVLAKYRFDPRRALALNVSYGQLKGSSTDAKTYYPLTTTYDFKSKVADVGLRMEYNFWPYGTGFEYRGAKRLTPYVAIGLGMTIAKADGKSTTGVNLPIGVGVKYKMADRLNLTAEWAMHFTSCDELDGVKDPYGIESSGLFKNTDCYSHLCLTLSYDIWAKCRTCHNDRD